MDMANTIGSLGPILYQGVTINEFSGQVDFARARSAGVNLVYIRATAGCDYADGNLSSYAAARNAGLLVGYYHYLNAQTESEARAQARHFLRTIGELPNDLRPALLVETVSGLTLEEANHVALAFLQTLQYASGLVPILYTDDRSAELLWTSAIADVYPLWVIDVQAEAPEVSDGLWSAWTGWQYTDTGRIDGIPGPAKLSSFTGNIIAESEEECLERPAPEGTKLICVTVAYGTPSPALPICLAHRCGKLCASTIFQIPTASIPAIASICGCRHLRPLPPVNPTPFGGGILFPALPGDWGWTSGN